MRKYDIVLVNFPFSDLSNTKLRPAVIVSNLSGDNLILCQITTKNRNITDYEIALSRQDCSGNITFQ